MRHDDLFIAIKNCVLRIRKSDGSEIWRTPIVKRVRSIVTLAVEKDTIYASANGELFALSPDTGQVRWRNELKGLGRDSILIATVPETDAST